MLDIFGYERGEQREVCDCPLVISEVDGIVEVCFLVVFNYVL